MSDKFSYSAQVAQDFEEAVARIVLGKPNHPDLAARAVKGQLKLNLLVVAVEAGHSRTLLYEKQGPYRDLRNKVLKLIGKEDKHKSEKESLSSKLARAREENVELERRVALTLSENAALLHRLADLERKLQLELDRNKILKKRFPESLTLKI